METKSEQLQNVKTDSKEGQIKAILYLLQTSLEDFKNEVDKTYALHQIGESTGLSKQIEDTIGKHPLINLNSISNKIEEECIKLIDTFTAKFFSLNKDIIDSAFRTRKSQLHYSIILKDDNEGNRNKIFDFYDMHPISEVVYKFPIYFQFTSAETISKIQSAEKIGI